MGRAEAVRQLTNARKQFCGLGTRKVKLLLNVRVRRCPLARALRLALEIEDASSVAKKYGGQWRYTYYEKKQHLIYELIGIFKEQGWMYGKQRSDGGYPRFIVYFELPGCEQISFHTDLDAEVQDYPHQWDGKQHSTLPKLERAIAQLLKLEVAHGNR